MLSFLRGEQFPLLRICFYPASQRLNRVDKFINLLKPTMHGREPQISDFIDVTQFGHHVSADLRRRDFAATSLDFMNDIVDRLFENYKTDGTFLTGLG